MNHMVQVPSMAQHSPHPAKAVSFLSPVLVCQRFNLLIVETSMDVIDRLTLHASCRILVDS